MKLQPSFGAAKLFMVVALLGGFPLVGQEFKDANSPSSGVAATRITSDSGSTAKDAECPEHEFVGTYQPDGRFKKATKRERFPQLNDDDMRPVEVPRSIDLHPLETVVEDYPAPTHATKAFKTRPRLAGIVDDIVTFAYGHERVLRGPTHVVADSKQRLIISDPQFPAVHVLDDKNSFRIAGGPGHRLRQPNGVAVDADDNIYVADGERGIVLVYDSQGRFIRNIGLVGGESIFQSPTGIALDAKAGRLYVLDSAIDQLVVLDLRGNLLKRVGNHRNPKSKVTFTYPSEIAVRNNTIIVLDSAGSRIQVLDLQCNVLSVFKTGNVDGPRAMQMGVALDSAANIYVSHPLWSGVRVFKQNGQFIGSLGDFAGGGALSITYSGLAIDPTDRMYLADTKHSRVDVFRRATQPAGEKEIRAVRTGAAK